eukprot:Nitzschia sp. Nitz4//scaffold137_size62074//35538//35897//NITZ4_006419-RA/size62074-processed-gene-0.91-mRNA-1//-1//CDS//3329535712//1130//frame0
MSTVESFLTRELDVRFIDARHITSEAKLSLGIHGYPTQEQMEFIKEEAVRIFNSLPASDQYALRKLNYDLETSKSPASSIVGGSSEYSSSSSHTRRPPRRHSSHEGNILASVFFGSREV